MTNEWLFTREPSTLRKLFWLMPFTIHHKKRMRFLEPILDDVETVLDVGCSDGKFLNLLKKKGKKVRGIEANPHHSEFCRKHFKIDVKNCLVQEADKLDADLVTAIALVEHLEDPEKELVSKVNAKYFFLVFPIESPIREEVGHITSLTFKQAMDMFYKHGWKPIKIDLYWKELIKSLDMYILLEKDG